MDDHALAVDVFDLDPRRFSPAYSGGIEQDKDHAVQAVGCGIDQPHDFILAKHGRQLMWHLREDEIVEGQIARFSVRLYRKRSAETRISTVPGSSFFSCSRKS